MGLKIESVNDIKDILQVVRESGLVGNIKITIPDCISIDVNAPIVSQVKKDDNKEEKKVTYQDIFGGQKEEFYPNGK